MAGFDLVEQAKTYKTFAEAGAFSSDLRLRVVVSVLHGRTLNEIWSAMPRGNSMRDGTWEAIADSFHAIALTRPGDFKNWLTFASPKLKRPRTILGLASLTGLLRAGSVFDKAEKGTLHETAIGKVLESLLKEDFLCGIDFPIPR